VSAVNDAFVGSRLMISVHSDAIGVVVAGVGQSYQIGRKKRQLGDFWEPLAP